MVTASIYQIERRFVGLPQSGDLCLVQEELPAIEDEEFLAEAVYLSVDPYMRKMAERLPLGSTMIGSQVAKITESKNIHYPQGKYVMAQFGWRTHTISRGKPSTTGVPVTLIPHEKLEDLPLSVAIGVLGTPGHSAYFGLLDILDPKSGQTLVVSGAAGAVGNHVGQIAKLKGCKVIGIAGSDKKGKWLTKELGFDEFINYKTDQVDEKLKQLAPEGVDLYFDNVGGDVLIAVLENMNVFGRISACGAISGYNEEMSLGPPIQRYFVSKQLYMEGFLNIRWKDRWMESFTENLKWIKEGKLKYRETVYEGFENMFNAFADMLRGGNFGKAVVKV